MNANWTPAGLLLAALLLLPCSELAAQIVPPPQMGAENRYLFTWNGELSGFQEKLLIGSFLGFDPEMRVNVDRATSTLKLLAYVPVDPEELRSVAAQHGVALLPGRPEPVPHLIPREQ